MWNIKCVLDSDSLQFAHDIGEYTLETIHLPNFANVTEANSFILAHYDTTIQAYYNELIIKFSDIFFIDKSIFTTIPICDKFRTIDSYNGGKYTTILQLSDDHVIELHTNFGIIVVNKYSNIRELRKNIKGLFIDNIWYNNKQLDENIPLCIAIGDSGFYGLYSDVIINKQTA